MKILITGGPKTGKTTLARELATKYKISKIYHTDDLILKYDWGFESDIVNSWLKEDNIIIEGTTVPRGIRKWLFNNDSGKPADIVYYLKEPKVKISKGQATMTKGIDTVWSEVLPELRKRGVTVV